MYKIFTNTLFLGKHIVYLPTCHSTNEVAANLLSHHPVFEGALVITDHQTAGKGQRGNSWDANAGENLTFSIVLKPHFLQIQEQFLLNIIVSLSIHDFFSLFMGDGLKIKWPNDIYFQDFKVGGVLIENFLKRNMIDSSIVGIGLNINQKQYQYPKANGLANICGRHFDLQGLLKDFLPFLETRYLQLKNGAKDSLVTQYLDKLYWKNEIRLFKTSKLFRGEILGIDTDGKLQVKSGEEILSFDVKEIQFVE